mmetsp:Transcript_19250/g.30196  ORF Transcript_19250/g.30196 Transcript_19250/m.30196 type:complete len:168 (+) Transcript_19250:1330-1833(+)
MRTNRTLRRQQRKRSQHSISSVAVQEQWRPQRSNHRHSHRRRRRQQKKSGGNANPFSFFGGLGNSVGGNSEEKENNKSSSATKMSKTAQKKKKQPVKRSVVAPKGVPVLKRWKPVKGNSIEGRIYGSNSFKDGVSVTTSSIKGKEGSTKFFKGSVVQTKSGSKYFLD